MEEHCLENPNLVLQPAEISSVVTSLLRAVSQVLINFHSAHLALVVQFVAESRFANCEFANLFFDFDELQLS